ncbi:MAG: pyruvate dehydrogenase (acetyl-transferring) E1 component subunit alpha, partial [Lutibacter sp.]|nr:pyruvate dehydrogenase (acetyl-transferring) E1 component subunit alpha [Lutibacter sp.]
EYRKIDPISQVLQVIKDKKYATDKDIKAWDQEVKGKVEECVQFAEESPYPDKQLLYDIVYEQKDYPFLKHR